MGTLKTFEIKNRFTNDVIFSGEYESFKSCVENAVKKGVSLEIANLENANLINANLENANLENADLENADLRNTNLRYAILTNTNLRYAILRNTNLTNANLRNTNLTNANLRYADLTNANLEIVDLTNANLENAYLWDTIGNMEQIKSLQLETYTIVYTDTVLQIGCENHNIKDWKTFTNEQILKMDGKEALRFWNKYKEMIFNIIELSPALPTKQ